jgi:hypothetical protein
MSITDQPTYDPTKTEGFRGSRYSETSSRVKDGTDLSIGSIG